MRFLGVEGVTGQERAIGKEIVAALRDVGVARKCIRFDQAHEKIPLPTETGNLIVDLPGVGSLKSAAPLLFMTHMDTVPLCAGARPQRKGRKIVNAAKTALGGDNRTGCGVLVTLAAELKRQKLAHPPLKLLFTVREESGLWGARCLDKAELKGIKAGFNVDGSAARNVVIGAVGADRWEAEIHGLAAHAGGAPEKGVSATLIMAEALASVHRDGWFGKVVQGDKFGTSNVGPVSGPTGGSAGDAANVVTDFVRVRGESRSHNAKFFKEITAAYKNAFAVAAKVIVNSAGKSGRVKFSAHTDYHPFHMRENLPVVQRARAAVGALGLEPDVRVANGGLDANWIVRHGLPTVTFGAGQNEVHTVKEWVDLTEYERACNLAVALATADS
ncbi:MAG: M20/M25/M40 family metallo-hydrolase [Pseudomonadota bacterium]